MEISLGKTKNIIFLSKEIVIETGNWIFSFVLAVHEQFNKKLKEDFDSCHLMYTAERTSKNIIDKGFDINNFENDFNNNYSRQSLAITAISPNIFLKETMDTPFEYFVTDPQFSSEFDQAFIN